jgi:hypothetical protein
MSDPSMTGRDNKAPVLHYTLAWHSSDNPDPEQRESNGPGQPEVARACLQPDEANSWR